MLRQPDFTPAGDALNWSCEPIKRGETIYGVVTGEMVGIHAHWNGECDKPCLRTYDGAELRCFCEDKPCGTRPKGYLPIIDRSGRRLVIVLSETAARDAKMFKVGDPVKFFRPDKVKTAIKVSKLTALEASQEWVKEMKKCVGHSILEFLCHLWQIKELTEAHGFKYRKSQFVPRTKSAKGNGE